jgi:hypothetical protein
MPDFKNMIFRKARALAVLATCMILAACQGNKHGKTFIQGSFPAYPGEKIALSEIDINKPLPLDTAIIGENGSFRFNFERDSAGIYLLKIDNKNYIILVLDKERLVKVTCPDRNVKMSFFVEGSPDTELLRQFELFTEANKKTVDSLTRVYNSRIRQPDFQFSKLALEALYDSVFQRQRDYVVRFVEENCGSLASLLVINRLFGQKKVLSEDLDPHYFLRLDTCLMSRYPGNKHVRAFHEKSARITQQLEYQEMVDLTLETGRQAPDLRLEDDGCKVVELKSFLGHDVVLYFWNSLNERSRIANAALKSLWLSQEHDGLVVFSVSFDTYPDQWKAAIAKDKIQGWINTCDNMGLRSGARSLFDVPEELPYFYLLDKDLKIRYRGSNLEDLRKMIISQ